VSQSTNVATAKTWHKMNSIDSIPSSFPFSVFFIMFLEINVVIIKV
jgi:hypothetical protein